VITTSTSCVTRHTALLIPVRLMIDDTANRTRTRRSSTIGVWGARTSAGTRPARRQHPIGSAYRNSADRRCPPPRIYSSTDGMFVHGELVKWCWRTKRRVGNLDWEPAARRARAQSGATSPSPTASAQPDGGVEARRALSAFAATNTSG